MPELPEMETYKHLLQEHIVNKKITRVEINRVKSINISQENFIQLVSQQTVIKVERRAKYLLFHLSNGQTLLLHLMLGGLLYFGGKNDFLDRTVQIHLFFNEEHLDFIGLRLGYLHIFPSGDSAYNEISDLGPEPLDGHFTLDEFLGLLDKRRGTLKSKLIDQKFLAGIGNCYSDEICFHAGILPKRKLEELSKQEKTQLYLSIQTILKEGIKYGGYMEQPFTKIDTLIGGYNKMCKVYDQEGKACPRCGGVVVREDISSRKAFFCSNCQK